WAMGEVGLLQRPLVALVGARNASSLGLRMARKLARELGEAGFVVVSGLARGIDTAAHEASLETGTIAVMAGGVDVIYPPENAPLAGRIAREGGLRLSEAAMGLQPQARHFPQRNRIVAGLARAVVVVEAAARSGSLITARLALDQGREVMAVPGHPFDARASGGNMLIRDGATLVRGADDVIAAIGEASASVDAHPRPVTAAPDTREAARDRAARGFGEAASGAEAPTPRPGADRRSRAETFALHQQILDRLAAHPLAEDQLIRDLAVPAATLAPHLLELELEGRIERGTGGLINRAD
ncbi:MAG: DNA-protecting protein DprA, partial [Alphaproteobacteria bacterium]